MPTNTSRGPELRVAILLTALLVAVIGACSKSSAQTSPTTASPVAQAAASPIIPGLPPGVRVEFVTPTPDMSPPPPDALKLVFQPGSLARYRAREMLLGRSYMTDAIGSTEQVEGTIYVTPEGKVVPNGSIVTVNLQNLKSDEAERDSFIKEVTLETSRFPDATFVPQTAEGLPARVRDNTGPVSFRLNGDLTIHGVTKQASWVVSGNVQGDTLTGTATTNVSLPDFGMTPPRVPVVLGVEDSVRLEISFTALRDRE